MGGVGNYAGYFAGPVYTTATYQSSDEQLKVNIHPFDHALQKINQLNPMAYQYDVQKYQGMNLPEGDQVGFIAQDMETVFPQLVRKTMQPALYENNDAKNGKLLREAVEFKAVNYTGLIPVMTKAIQEQQEEIEALKKQNELLMQRLEKLENKK